MSALLWVEHLRRERMATALQAQLSVAVAIYQSTPGPETSAPMLDALRRLTDTITNRDVQPEWFDEQRERRMQEHQAAADKAALHEAMDSLAAQPGWKDATIL